MDDKTKQRLTALTNALIERHPQWPTGKAHWIAMRAFSIYGTSNGG